jgi:hypothetical protein
MRVVIKQRSSIMLAFFTMLYREYCRATTSDAQSRAVATRKIGRRHDASRQWQQAERC